MSAERTGSDRRSGDRRITARIDRRQTVTVLMEHDRRSGSDRRSQSRRTGIDRREAAFTA